MIHLLVFEPSVDMPILLSVNLIELDERQSRECREHLARVSRGCPTPEDLALEPDRVGSKVPEIIGKQEEPDEQTELVVRERRRLLVFEHFWLYRPNSTRHLLPTRSEQFTKCQKNLPGHKGLLGYYRVAQRFES